MAEILGRSFVLRKGSAAGVGGTVIAACRTKGYTINNTPIDISSDDSAGVREMLDAIGEQAVEFSVSGLTSDTVLATAALEVIDAIDEYTMAWGTSAKLYGDFIISSYAQTGEYNGAVTFEATLQSSGVVTLSGAV